MKVLLVNSLYAPDETGGAERAVRVLAEELLRRGVDVTGACLSSQGRLTRDTVNGVPVVRLPLANIYFPFRREAAHPTWQRLLWHLIDDWNPLMARRLGQVMDEIQPDVVNLHNLAGLSASAIGAARAHAGCRSCKPCTTTTSCVRAPPCSITAGSAGRRATAAVRSPAAAVQAAASRSRRASARPCCIRWPRPVHSRMHGGAWSSTTRTRLLAPTAACPSILPCSLVLHQFHCVLHRCTGLSDI